ncbi:hypothetical protein B9Z19DRAFT_1083753 [Tuber borchii]|uniref:Uncharacterized protein n=1 Tax=Tuber borchii TaxID=42251 RepID=A0A2T6ZSV2_TUBBO|nr:hypothetical protein B9Z19DRAFT_1083753 [Tuber borchii]
MPRSPAVYIPLEWVGFLLRVIASYACCLLVPGPSPLTRPATMYAIGSYRGRRKNSIIYGSHHHHQHHNHHK